MVPIAMGTFDVRNEKPKKIAVATNSGGRRRTLASPPYKHVTKTMTARRKRQSVTVCRIGNTATP